VNGFQGGNSQYCNGLVITVAIQKLCICKGYEPYNHSNTLAKVAWK